MAYTQYGPFNTGAAPGISITFLNNLETFLLGINSLATDSTISSNGSGAATLAQLLMTTGSIKRIARFTGSATQTINHFWYEQADIVLPYYNGAFGTAPTQAIAVKNESSTSFTVVAQTGYSWTALAIKF